MFTSDKELIESRGYIIVKIGGMERAVKNPRVFGMDSRPVVENLTRSFMDGLKIKPVVVLTSRALEGKTQAERDVMVLELIPKDKIYVTPES